MKHNYPHLRTGGNTILSMLLLFIFTLTASTAFADTEPANNSAATTPDVIAPNGMQSGTIGPNSSDANDYYKITTTADGTIDFTINIANNEYVGIYLYDADGTTQLNSAGNYGNVSLSQSGLAAGTYYILVYKNSGNPAAAYTLTNTFTAAPLTNDAEPNDTWQSANNFSPNSSTTGHIAFRNNGGAIDVNDFYKLVTTQDGNITISLTNDNNNYVGIYLYDADGNTQLGTTSNYAGSGISFTVNGLAAGTYYVLVYRNSGNSHSSYTLTNSIASPTLANDVEPNDDVANATNFAVNTNTTGHIAFRKNGGALDVNDYYKLVTTQDGNITISLTNDNNNYVGIYLYDADGNTQLGTTSNYAGNGISFTVNGLAAGTYYVLVYRNSGNSHSAYTLTNSLTPALYNNDAEPNNTFATATLLNNNPNRQGHISYRNNGGTMDNSDYYKIIMNTAGDLKMDITFENNHYTGIYLYDANQSQIWTSGGYNLTYNINQTGLAAGDYYLLVYRNAGNNDYNSYTITNFQIPCTTTAASITADGATTFCQGNSVTLSTTESYQTYAWTGGGNTNSKTVTTSGNYQLVGTDYDGCPHTSNTISVTVNPTPTPTITASGATTFCNGGSVTLTSSANAGNVWSTGATTKSITVTTSGNYSVTVTANSCSGTSATTTVNVQTCNVWYQDYDGDGYGNPNVVLNQPTQPAGYVLDNTDCDDNDATMHAKYSFYADSDGDGFGTGSAIEVCAVNANTPPTGYSTSNTDCAPNDGNKWRSATVYTDADGDGYTIGAAQTICYGAAIPANLITSSLGNDCNDNDATMHTVAATPTVSANGSTTICASGSVSLSSNATTGNQWYNQTGAIAGATAQQYVASAAGTYYVIVGTGNCAGNASNQIAVTQQSAANNVVLANSQLSNINLVKTCDENGWTYYTNPANTSQFVFGVQWGNNTNAKNNAVPVLTINNNLYSEQLTSPTGSEKATFVMNRSWNINNAGTLSDPISIRFFYAASEKQAVINASAAFENSYPSSIQKTPSWFKTVGTSYHAPTIVTPAGLDNSILLTDANVAGATINGVLYAQFDNISSLSGGSFAAGNGPGVVLPIKLVEFTGTKTNEYTNNFQWKVACTDNRTNTIQLQRGATPDNFNTIYTVATSISNCALPFAHTDSKPQAGANYYRLKLVDADGVISYSKIILINNAVDDKQIVRLSPNPTSRNTTLTIFATMDQQVSVSVQDVAGRVVMHKMLFVYKGQNNIELNISALANGIYSVTVQDGKGKSTSTKLIKE